MCIGVFVKQKIFMYKNINHLHGEFSLGILWLYIAVNESTTKDQDTKKYKSISALDYVVYGILCTSNFVFSIDTMLIGVY